jgi:DMSO/TMAO reductase YedYZ heme-binding membrane subunit
MSAGGPSALFELSLDPKLAWYLTRASGLVLLVLLTVAVLLGVGSRLGAAGGRVPRFVATDLHRRISLLATAFLGLHIATSIADSWATITWLDAVVPFVGSYRPVWLGLGTLAVDLLLAVVVTSLLRHRLGPRSWRAVHLLAYAAWPVAVLHGLGTGSDTQRSWVLVLTLGCVGAVLLALGRRILPLPLPPHAHHGSPEANSLRFRALHGGVGRGMRWLVAVVVLPLVPLALAAWALDGPLAPGWGQRAGTPPPPAAGSAP